jgi:hypothetical protein
MLQLLLLVSKPSAQVQEMPFLSMEMTSVTPIFAVLAGGMVTTLLCLLLELRMYKSRKQKQKNESFGNV